MAILMPSELIVACRMSACVGILSLLSAAQLGAVMQLALIIGGLGLAYCLFFVIHIIR